MNTYHKTGVFVETVRGVVVGYFVGWRGRRYGQVKNIRQDLYFDTEEAATTYRDYMEETRKSLARSRKQIA